jgi:4-hydroxy-tetrahydrodipicolinate synthase
MALGGLCVPIPTLFDDSGGIDAGKMTRFTRGLCDAKVDHIFALGTLGEFPLIDDGERPVLLEAVIESVSWHADAWIGCGAPSVRQALRYAEGAAEAGAAALVAVPPYFLNPSPAAILDYYRKIHAAVKLPLLAYNIPHHVGYALQPAWVHRLGQEGVLAGIKDTSGSIESVRSFLSGAPVGFGVLPGDDVLALEAIRGGSVGAIMGVANLVPKLCVALVREARAGDDGAARPLQRLVDRIVAVIAQGPFPAVDKFLAARLRGAGVGYREPYRALTKEEEERVLGALGPVEAELRAFL